MTIITTIRDGLAPNPDTGLGGANEGHIQGFQDDVISGIIGGVVDKNAGHCQVTQNDPLGMSVLVADGVVYVPNADYLENDPTTTKFYRVVIRNQSALTVASNSLGHMRIDAVDVEINKNTVPNEYGSNVATVVVNTGSSAVTPPTLADNAYRLALIEVPNGATEIITEIIGDERDQIEVSTDLAVTPTATQTLTNKTLTSPKIITSINDANGNEIFETPATASAVNHLKSINAATGGSPALNAAGDGTNINILFDGKGTGLVIPRMAVPQGFLINGKISVTVASNNLIVAIKTIQGNDPSANDPVHVRIGDTVRTITSALSVTINAGTNWFNAGSAELATKEIDYFVYLGYNATDGVVIGFSRIPFATSYGDFSATTTNEKYAAISTITTAASTDYYENIGRFAATLSAGAGYTWSVPTFTATNLIQRPIFRTRRLDFAPTLAGGTGASVAGAVYWIENDLLHYSIKNISNTSDSTTKSFIAPFALKSGYALFASAVIFVRDNGSNQTTAGHLEMTDGSSTVQAFKSFYETAWTASNEAALYIPLVSYFI